MSDKEPSIVEIRQALEAITACIGPGPGLRELLPDYSARIQLSFCTNDLLELLPEAFIEDRFRRLLLPGKVWMPIPELQMDYPTEGMPVSLAVFMSVLPKSFWTREAYDHLHQTIIIPHCLLAKALWSEKDLFTYARLPKLDLTDLDED